MSDQEKLIEGLKQRLNSLGARAKDLSDEAEKKDQIRKAIRVYGSDKRIEKLKTNDFLSEYNCLVTHINGLEAKINNLENG